MVKQDKDIEIISLTPETIAEYGVCGYKDVEKHLELQRKIEWFTKFYPKGLTIIRSPQCPYSVKNVNAIMKTAEKMHLQVKLVDLDDVSAVQQVPCAFGTFCILYNGKVISHHPISNGRFENIINGIMKKSG